jgi:predicted phosphodiesterase
MNKDYIAVDCHVGYRWTGDQYISIWRFQEQILPDETVIYGGDTVELAWLTGKELLASPYYKRWCHQKQGEAIYVSGNHDPQNLWPAGRGDGYSPAPGVLVMHGHQFDNLHDAAWKRALYRLGPFFRDAWFSTPLQQKMHGDNSWQDHNAAIWSRAMQWLEAAPYQVLIIGHTHDTVVMERPELNKTLIALGSLPEDGIYAELAENSLLIRNINDGGDVQWGIPIANPL